GHGSLLLHRVRADHHREQCREQQDRDNEHGRPAREGPAEREGTRCTGATTLPASASRRQDSVCALCPSSAPSSAPAPTSRLLSTGPTGEDKVDSATRHASANPKRPPAIVQNRCERRIQPSRWHRKPPPTTNTTPPTTAPRISPPRPTAWPSMEPSAPPAPPSADIARKRKSRPTTPS